MLIFVKFSVMNRKELIKAFCRYYDGADKNPFVEDTLSRFWEWERTWVDLTLESVEKNELPQQASDILNNYIRAGLDDFRKNDGIPISLKAVLYNRYDQWFYDGPEGFKLWFNKYYKERA